MEVKEEINYNLMTNINLIPTQLDRFLIMSQPEDEVHIEEVMQSETLIITNVTHNFYIVVESIAKFQDFYQFVDTIKQIIKNKFPNYVIEIDRTAKTKYEKI